MHHQIAVVGSGKILALLEVLLLLLPLAEDAFDGLLLCILVSSRVACVRTLDDINAILKSRPRVRPATPIATKRAMAAHAAGLVGPFIPTCIMTNGLLSLAGIYLGGECVTCTNGFTGDGPELVYSVLVRMTAWRILWRTFCWWVAVRACDLL